MDIIKGVAGAPGIAIAKVLLLKKMEMTIIKKGGSHQDEILKLENAIELADADLFIIINKVKKELSEKESDVFVAHQLMLNDPTWIQEAKDLICSEHVSAEFACNAILTKQQKIFQLMDDPYMRERAIDIEDIISRLLKHLLHIDDNDNHTTENVIIVSEELTPSDTISLSRSKVKGMAVDKGGSTSHTTIISRTLGIPAVVGLKNLSLKVKNDDMIIIDGNTGIIIINPSSDQLKIYSKKIKMYEQQQLNLEKYKDVIIKTTDGCQICVEGNIGGIEDAKLAFEKGSEGIGLFRTEFSYMNSKKWPTENELYECYKKILLVNPKEVVTFRTLDIGGDKVLPYYKFDHEDNPFLGERSIRFSFSKPEIFITQLRALIKAANYGKTAIMFPMIATLNELKKAKKIFNQCYIDLIKEGEKVPTLKDIKIGMMIEVPVSALLSDQFAKEVDFFSIGTNDLIQYSMAADRLSEKVRYLYQPTNPSILRLINMTIKNALKENIRVIVCGEAAASPEMIPLLLGIGLRIFSVSPGSILATKKLLSQLSCKKTSLLAKKALML